MQTVLDALCSKRDKLKAYIEPHRALMSPVRRIPPETLTEIFIRCLPSDRPPVRSSEEAPLLLTTICRSWREIALSAPALWSSIHVSFPLVDRFEVLSRRMGGTVTWLEQSGSLAISLSVHSSVPMSHRPLSLNDHRVLTLATEIIKSLMQYSGRLAEVTLQLPAVLFPLILELSPSTFPLLFSLQLYGHNSVQKIKMKQVF